ncbi:MAG: hypothetical protein ACJATT_004057 [Myxococcota bacterium]|jgi:hypothetical protein
MSDENEEGLPTPPHLSSEFYVWLWWESERNNARFDLADPIGQVEVWVDERLSFRRPGDSKVSAVLTGDDASTTLESRAALAGGKVVEEIRLRIRRDDREYSVSLKGAAVSIQRAKLPPSGTDADESPLYDRMFHYEELEKVVGALFIAFANARQADAWESSTLPQMKTWSQGGLAAG